MHVVLTGASSFTGYWFAQALSRAGHEVTCVQRRAEGSYEDLRAQRLRALAAHCRIFWDAPFGSPNFLAALDAAGAAHPVEALCHHAAVVENYKSPEFDAVAATAANTRGLAEVLTRLQAQGCRRLVITGSVFEPGEGAGTLPLRGFSRYGLSKALSAQVAAFYAQQAGWSCGKFVIPNPFGPWEEPRFTDYLLRCWAAGEVPRIATPAYVRDNIHVSLLALSYVRFLSDLPESGEHACHPSGYVESQGAFAVRFAAALGPRLGLACPLELARQIEFPEPPVRINTGPANVPEGAWSESVAWDELADYYAARHRIALAGARG